MLHAIPDFSIKIDTIRHKSFAIGIVLVYLFTGRITCCYPREVVVKKAQTMNERWLTVDEICVYLSITNETIYKWIEQRNMPGHRVGRRWMFKKAEVDDWVRSGGAADKPDKRDAP
jgi:excisionase family DNA binding protein